MGTGRTWQNKHSGQCMILAGEPDILRPETRIIRAGEESTKERGGQTRSNLHDHPPIAGLGNDLAGRSAHRVVRLDGEIISVDLKGITTGQKATPALPR